LTAPLSDESPINRLLSRLKGVKAAGRDRWMAKCPIHDDKQASLSVRVGGDQRAVMYCHARCDTRAVVAAIGLTMADLFLGGAKPTLRVEPGAKAQGVETRKRLVKTYPYTDADGTLLYEVCRFEPKSGGFPQRRPTAAGDWEWGMGDVSPVLYRLPDLIEAVAADRVIYIAEGEKDVDNLVALGYPATTSPFGAGKWREEYSPILADAHVVILPDNDQPGHEHALAVAESLVKVGAHVRMVVLPNVPVKGDVSDWLAAGGTAAKLDQFVAEAAPWKLGDPIPVPPSPPKFKLYNVTDLKNLPPMEWLVGEEGAGVIPSKALLAIFGSPGAGKSFIAADLACTLASRRPNANPLWFGNGIRRGAVLYVVAEGQEGFRQRIAAWLHHHQVEDRDMQIGFVLEPVNLHGSDDVSHILRTADLLREPPSLIVFDTLARCMVGGDDNSSSDIGAVVDRGDRVRRETGGSVLFVHHAKKEGDVERGSGALRAGVDTLVLARDDEESGRVLSCEKQKDADPFDPITFYLKSVGASSVVTDEMPGDLKFLTANQRKLLAALDLFPSGATSTEWLRASGVPDRSFYRVRQNLILKRYVNESERSRFFLQPMGKIAINNPY
jgi:hypothetical protein